jgi:hypothetical protein
LNRNTITTQCSIKIMENAHVIYPWPHGTLSPQGSWKL